MFAVIRRQSEIFVAEAVQIFFRDVVRSPRVVRSAQRQEQSERLVAVCHFLQPFYSEVGHKIGFVALGIDFFRGIQVVVRLRRVVFVVEIIRREVAVKAQSVLAGRHERVFRVVVVAQLCRVQVPFTDIRRIVTCVVQNVGKALVMRIHSDLVYNHAGGSGIFTGQQTCAIGCADGVSGNCVGYVGAIARQVVYIRSFRQRIAVVTDRRPT